MLGHLTEDSAMAENLSTMEFMLRNVLVGKTEETVRETLVHIHGLLSEVLYPPAPPVDPELEALLAEEEEIERRYVKSETAEIVEE